MANATLIDQRRIDRAGWLGAVGIAVTLAASWWWLLFLPLGDSHDGRINGRFGIHVANFLDLGAAESGFGSSLAPLAEGSYAHHPPLINAIQVTFGWVFGQGEWQLHLVGWLAGIATVLLIVGVMRLMGMAWPACLVAVALTAATPMFWIYARLGLGMAPGLFLVLAVLRFRRDPASNAGPMVLAAVVIAVGSSWPNALLAAVLALWQFRTQRRAALQMALAGTLTGLAVFAWILQATTVAELAGHTQARLTAPADLAGYVTQYKFFYTTLFPSWYLWLMVPALFAGVADRRTRPVVLILTSIVVAWTVALPEAAFVHDFWTYPLLGPVIIGIAVLVHWASFGPWWRQIAMPSVLMVLAVVTFVQLQRGPLPDAYFVQPSEAGRLLSDIGPAPGQQIAYVAGPIALPRWMTYYWGLDVQNLTAATLDSVDPSYLVLIRTDRPPTWAPTPDVNEAVGTSGRYALFEVGTLDVDASR